MLLIVLGAFFGLAGAGVVVGVLLHVIDASLVVMGIAFVVTGVPLILGGVAMRRLTGRTEGMVSSALAMARALLPDEELLRDGLAGTARLTSVTQTTTTVNDQPVLELQLVVSVPGRPDYPASLRQMVPLIRLARTQPGAVLAVKVDPQRPDRIGIDWDGQPGVVPR
jgi:hypothetical protein